ncbi:hypothetical protein FQ142_13370 [Microbacterium sp. ANT_H45B]|uniref:hypothetical protein n=1 Tax=Microbacterium sp. ANT_H45B TaxID=2597346 RepID=UPI0011F02743|nr:hypothetical protein [Microbacterium sp. ANT_H45B]KAA0959853.1 hypothetical protein FQ142_13370 [Microbacterium sp. ANT_H45B]
MTKRVFGVSSLIVLALLATGCSASGSDDTDSGKIASSMSVLFEEALAGEVNDFERAVLERGVEDGRIGQSDYAEATTMYATCMSGAGYALERTDHLNGLIEFQPPALTASQEIDDLMAMDYECMSTTGGNVIRLYELQQGNPSLLRDTATVAAECLAASGVVPPDFDKEDYRQAFSSDGKLSELSFDVTDPRVGSCLYGIGVTVGIDE